MKVSELIAKLQKMPEEFEVLVYSVSPDSVWAGAIEISEISRDDEGAVYLQPEHKLTPIDYPKNDVHP